MAALRRLSPLVINSTKVQFAHRTTPVAFITSFKLGASFSSSSPAAMSSAKELVDSTIAQNDVVVFSKSYCPYCKTAKQIISSETSDATILELDQRDDGSEIQAYLKQLNGQGTVPHVYIRQKFIGGCSDLQKVAKPQLKKLISGA